MGGLSALVRLIPARAGNTSDSSACWPCCSAHPRSRGEHTIASIVACSMTGSSPLARGTPKLVHAAELSARLIPARAGNTGLASWRGGWFPAHPRSRGEHIKAPGAALNSYGSSPLARGTLVIISRMNNGGRLIPARAGNIPPCPGEHQSPAAHPRSRGEHLAGLLNPCLKGGSSPLARGTS